MTQEFMYRGLVMIKVSDKRAQLVRMNTTTIAEDEKDALKKIKEDIEKEIKSSFKTDEIDPYLIRLFPKYLKRGAYIGS